jgi:hypothetical protein
MQTILLLVPGQVIAVATLWAYVMLSPEYRRGEIFSLPLLFFAIVMAIHLTFPLSIMRWICIGIDGLILAVTFAARVIDIRQQKAWK